MELSVKCASQICYENINKPLDGAYFVDFCIEINVNKKMINCQTFWKMSPAVFSSTVVGVTELELGNAADINIKQLMFQ